LFTTAQRLITPGDPAMVVRGIRGAITVTEDFPEVISSATRELLQAILSVNPELHASDLACVFFTLTEDLNSVFPAEGARELGWSQVPMLCSREIAVPGSLPKCLRVLLLWNTDLPQEEIQHVYLKEAQVLRPDLNHK
jgi:chorismate mutase